MCRNSTQAESSTAHDQMRTEPPCACARGGVVSADRKVERASHEIECQRVVAREARSEVDRHNRWLLPTKKRPRVPCGTAHGLVSASTANSLLPNTASGCGFVNL